jgi:hypothetical protein
MPISFDLPIWHVPGRDLKGKMIISGKAVSLDNLVNDWNVCTTQLRQIYVDGWSGWHIFAHPLVPNVLVASAAHLYDRFTFAPKEVEIGTL